MQKHCKPSKIQISSDLPFSSMIISWTRRSFSWAFASIFIRRIASKSKCTKSALARGPKGKNCLEGNAFFPETLYKLLYLHMIYLYMFCLMGFATCCINMMNQKSSSRMETSINTSMICKLSYLFELFIQSKHIHKPLQK